jgi:outer membrane protein TolC
MRALVITTTLAGITALGGCTSPDAPMFEVRDFQKPEASHASENAPVPLEKLRARPVATTLPSPAEARGGTATMYTTPATQSLPQYKTEFRRMTLQQCIHLAAANSLTVRVAGYQPAIDQARVVEAKAKFDPTFFEQFQFQHTDVIQPSAENPTIDNPLGAPVRFGLLNSTTGIKQDTETGAEIQLSYDLGYTDRVIPAVLFQPGLVNPFFNDELTLKITQPLLQNFGREANYARINIARNTQGQSLLDFRMALEKQMSDIEETYWQLVQAERDLVIRQDLVQRAKDTETLIKARLGTDATDIDVAQADAAVAMRAADIPVTRATVEKLSNRLKALINDPDFPASSGPLLLPADMPTEQPVQFDPEESIRTALDYRADLAQERLKIDSAYVTQKAAQNNELPTLNTMVSFGVEGDSNTLGGMFRSTGNGNLLDYTLGFELDVPLGFREARAIFRRTQLARYQEITHYQELEAKAANEVKDAIADVTSRWEQIDLARQARFKSQHALSLLEDRIQNKGLALSPAITQTRLQYQMDFANGQESEMEAIAQYNIALSKLELAKGTLLRYNSVTMEEEQPNSELPEEPGASLHR